MSAAPFDRSVLEVAPLLLGWTLRHGDCAGVVVETEAYHASEAACHAYVGRTARSSTLFGEPGTAYVYRSYGIHALVNVVCEPLEVGAAVLIRALEPTEGVAAMVSRRGGVAFEQLCNGPGKLTQALGIGLDDNDTSLIDGPVRLEPPAGGIYATPPPHVACAPRVGITKAVDLPWRFCALGSRHVSKPWPPAVRESARRPARR